MALRTVAGLRSRVYAAVVRHRDDERDGDALSRLVSDVDSAQDVLLLRCLLPSAVAASVSVAAITTCAILLPTAGFLLAAGLVVVGMVLPAIGAVAAKRMSAGIAPLHAELAVRSLDLVDGRWDLAAFGGTAAAEQRAERVAARLGRSERMAAYTGAVLTGIGILLQGLICVLVTLLAVRAGADGVLVAVLALTALAAFEPVLPLADAAQRWVELWPVARRVAELLKPVASPPRPLPAERIELTGVRVTFGAVVALNDVSFRVEPGRAVAIVGASGAGKARCWRCWPVSYARRPVPYSCRHRGS
ncbi:ABC transporter ATP-binding protein [Fodinicola feengrottensis]|uniref:hypothetical protein n=1 Tax=Fodinicola feengrottensis TaxID=435914 RepID=UPI002441EC1D|nr:hypothetical protein [Fodinicola feengrottensis]